MVHDMDGRSLKLPQSGSASQLPLKGSPLAVKRPFSLQPGPIPEGTGAKRLGEFPGAAIPQATRKAPFFPYKYMK